jgi:hypothetical protein
MWARCAFPLMIVVELRKAHHRACGVEHGAHGVTRIEPRQRVERQGVRPPALLLVGLQQ